MIKLHEAQTPWRRRGRMSLGELPFVENPSWVPQLRFGWMIGWLSFLVWKINPTSKALPSYGWWVFFCIRSPLVFHLSLKHLEHHLGETLAIYTQYYFYFIITYKSELSQLLGDIRCLTLRSFWMCPLKSPEQGHSFKFWPRIADPLCNVWHFGVPSQALRTVPSSLLKPKSLGVTGPPPSFHGSDVTRRFQAYFDIPRLLLDPPHKR